jgi:hypothetical protein
MSTEREKWRPIKYIEYFLLAQVHRLITMAVSMSSVVSVAMIRGGQPKPR